MITSSTINKLDLIDMITARESPNENENLLYDLYAVSQHIGTTITFNGHYTAV